MPALNRNLVAAAVALAFFAAARPAPAQDLPRTTAEITDYTATSTYADVMSFIGSLQKLSPFIRVETLAVSAEGRDIPLLVIGKPLPASPQTLKGDDKRMVVYIEANIHAGEVEGKEAVQMLVRDILTDPRLPYLDKLILVVAPIFNPDGNDKMSPENRPGQIGPVKGSGVRHNGQTLDLNRDCMKIESPEIRGMIRNVLLRWDPVLAVDCHTTDGSFHEEPVTYSWQLCPNGDQTLIVYGRDKMLPAVGRELEKKYKVMSVQYGDPKDFRDMNSGWQTFGHQPRYVTNYIGLRNRLTILDENYNYTDFKTRVNGCYYFLKSILDYSAEHAAEMSRLVAEADRRAVERGLAPAEKDVFGLDMEAKPLPDKITIHGYEMEPAPAPAPGQNPPPFPMMQKHSDRKKTYVLTYYADFVPKRTVRLPYAYVLPIFGDEVAAKLLEHGLVVEKLTEPASLDVEAFHIKELKASDRLYQGHRMNKISGEYATERKDFPVGTLVVRLAQPLGSLAAYLLEPESDDGLIIWNFLDRYLVAEWGRGFQTCPIYKLQTPRDLPLRTVK